MWRRLSPLASRFSGGLASMGMTAGLPQRRYLVVGNAARGVTKSCERVIQMADVVGSGAVGKERLCAGDLLSIMDLCAGRTAGYFMTSSPFLFGKGDVALATVAVNNTAFKKPAMNGDLIIATGHIIFAHNSSLGVQVVVRNQSALVPEPQVIAESYFTMASISRSTLKVEKGVIPAVELTTPEELQAHAVYSRIRSSEKATAEAMSKFSSDGTMNLETLEDPVNRRKTTKVALRDTIVRATRIYGSQYLNSNHSVFGGEILRWMELHATHCGRVFNCNPHVYSICMHSMEFRSPILAYDIVSLMSHVSYVRNTTMEVDVELTVESENKATVTNRACFVLINTDAEGNKLEITNGLDLLHSKPHRLMEYAAARFRYERRLQSKLLEERMAAAATAADPSTVPSPP